MQEYGEKEITLSPNDVSTLALLGQTLPRTLHGSVSDPAAVQLLAKAEQYSKQAIEITPTLPKPENLTDEAFASAKNQALAMAHSGLGLVFVRRGKNAEAIPELEQAVKIDPNPDPVNYYLLGMANKTTSHFDDAVAAFNKCAAMTGALAGDVQDSGRRCEEARHDATERAEVNQAAGAAELCKRLSGSRTEHLRNV